MQYTPTYKLCLLCSLLLCCGAAADFLPQFTAFGWIWRGMLVVLIILSSADFLSIRRLIEVEEVEVTRLMQSTLPVGVWLTGKITITNNGNTVLSGRIRDRLDHTFILRPEYNDIILQQGQTITLEYRFRAGERGERRIEGVDFLCTSPAGFWRRRHFFPCLHTVRVFPNFKTLERFTLLAARSELSSMGIKMRRKPGAGQNFYQLRPYRAGDTLRHIDWKATSRRQDLISKEYQDERSQQIVMVLDCGRRMLHLEQGESQFDQVLNSMLLLAHVAAGQGDAVGLLASGAKLHCYPPQKKSGGVYNLVQGAAALFPTTAAVDFYQITRELLILLKKRTFIILLTNTRGEEHGAVVEMAEKLNRTHQLVVANLMEKEIALQQKRRIGGLDDALRYHALLGYLRERQELAARLRRAGCYTLDLTAEELPPALVNSYLDLRD